jgi:hypothetical protein
VIRVVVRALDRARYPHGATRAQYLGGLSLAVWWFVTVVFLLAWVDRVMWGPW